MKSKDDYLEVYAAIALLTIVALIFGMGFVAGLMWR